MIPPLVNRKIKSKKVMETKIQDDALKSGNNSQSGVNNISIKNVEDFRESDLYDVGSIKIEECDLIKVIKQEEAYDKEESKQLKLENGSTLDFNFFSKENKHVYNNEDQCNISEQKCSTSSISKAELLVHINQNSYRCSLCEYKCLRQRNFDQHMTQHAGEKPYKCNVCEYKCFRKGNLDRHMRQHTSKKLYECNVCEYKCSLKRIFDEHNMKHHTGEKPFECNVCDYKCLRKGNFNRHMKRHADEKPYKSTICK